MEEQQSEKKITVSLDVPSKPKESFLLVREKFSDSAEIDYDGLEEHIHYQFKNRELLRDALYPMVPKRLKADKLKFEHLEFVGDSVLGLIIRERLATLFPKENRGNIVELYNSLTKNQTLADVYFRNLELEHYIPFSEKKSCKICNLVESLIGGIYLDDSTNGFINSKKFVMHILNDHVLGEKIREVSLLKGVSLTPSILPALEEIIKSVCTPERLESDSPKTLLNEVLLGLWTDRPTYEFSLKINGERVPRFSAIVSGAQIGNVFQGEGDTRQEAEEDAAHNALNFLAKRELLQKKDSGIVNKTFRTRLKESLDILGYNWKFKDLTPQSTIKAQIKFKGVVVGEDTGSSQEKAKEMAAYQACQYFEKNPISQENRQQRSKNYRVLLKEFFELVGSSNCKVGEPTLSQDGYKCHIEIGGNVVVSGTGRSKAEAKEHAAKEAFLFLGRENAANYSPLLQLFLALEGLDQCEFNNITPCQTFLYRVVDGDKVLGEGIGFSGTEAKEHAAKEAYFRLIQIETEKAECRERLKRGEPLKPLVRKVPAGVKQSSLEVQKLPQQPVAKQISTKLGKKSRPHKDSSRKQKGKLTLEQHPRPPLPKVPAAVKQPSVEASKLS